MEYFYQEVRYDKVQEQDLMQALQLQYLTALEIAKMVNDQLEKELFLLMLN